MSVLVHCFNSCTPGIIYSPISSCCMGVASRWNYNGECMIKIFRGAGMVTPSKPPAPYEQLSPLSTPCLRCFWKDLFMTPTLPPTSRIFHCYPLPIHHPFFPHKNVDHTLRCSAFYGVYNMSVVSVMFLYPSNDGARTEIALYNKSDPCTFSIST